jgi:pilus assembly protein CpaB
VDLVVTLRGSGQADESMSRTVASNVLVLTAGTKFDQEQAKDGKAQPSTVVTLAVSPSDAERVALASSEGKISLALRNPLDVTPTETAGVHVAALRLGMGSAPPEPMKAKPAAPHRPLAVVPPPPPTPSTVPYTVETIRAAKRGEEVVR